MQQLKAANADVLLPSSYTTDGILLVKTMNELGYKPNAILAQDAGFSEKASTTPSARTWSAAMTRGSFSLDLAAKRPTVGKVNEMFKKRSGKDLNDLSSREFMAMIVLADAINRAKAADGPEDPRRAGRDRHPGRHDDHALEAGEVRRNRPEPGRRSRAPAMDGREVRDLLAGERRDRRGQVPHEQDVRGGPPAP